MNRFNWTKKVTVLLAAICVTLVGIGAYTNTLAQDWLLQVEGVPISRELYSFFVTEALIEAERDAYGVPTDMQALREDVNARAAAFVAVNSELYRMRITLDQLTKARVAERTSYLWRVFGNYYEAMGICKETVGIAQRGLAARDQLFRALYDTGGVREVEEERIQSFFYGNYVAFMGVRLFFTVTEEDGSERGMTGTERNDLLASMRQLATAANQEEGEDFFTLAQQDNFATAMSYATPMVSVVQRIVDLPADDFEAVRGLDPEQVSVLEFEDGLIIARGVNMRESPEEYFDVFRASCLRALMSDEFEQTLEEELFVQFQADENTAAVDALLNGWDWSWGWRA